MPSITQQQIDSANQTDLAEFLSSRGIQLRKQSGQYVWEDQNVWIHGCEWYSHYEQTGGHAVRFVMKYFDKSVPEAVNELLGNTIVPYISTKMEHPYVQLPDKNSSTYRIYMYLRNVRCISPEVINAFVKMGLLYEDAEYHNCVFVGRDEKGKPGHCHKRSTVSGFKQTVEGSRSEYAFHFDGKDDTIYAFEAPIDMLAYISMHPVDWQQHSYVALCSVSEKALIHQLDTHPELDRIVLCLDNDRAGQEAVERIKKSLREKGYTDIRVQIPLNKDWDEDLQEITHTNSQRQKEGSQWRESARSSLSLS